MAVDLARDIEVGDWVQVLRDPHSDARFWRQMRGRVVQAWGSSHDHHFVLVEFLRSEKGREVIWQGIIREGDLRKIEPDKKLVLR